MPALFSCCCTPNSKVVEPHRFTAERRHERPMRVAILGSDPRRQRLRSRPDDGMNAFCSEATSAQVVNFIQTVARFAGSTTVSVTAPLVPKVAD
jgi:hypothetical protein